MEYNFFDYDVIDILDVCVGEAINRKLTRIGIFRLFTHLINCPSNPIYEYLYGLGYTYEDLIETLDKLMKENEEKEELINYWSTDKEISEKKPEEIVYETFENSYSNFLYIEFTLEISQCIAKAMELARKVDSETVTVDLLCKGIIGIMPESISKFFLNLKLDPDVVKEDFRLEYETMENENNTIPENIADFVEVINDKIDITQKCRILGRDKEVQKLWNILLKSNKRNSILVGEPGVGKTAIIEKLTYDIMTEKAPKDFKDYLVLSMDVNSSVAGTMYRGQAEERFKDLINFLKKNQKVILFIDEIHTILGAGSTGDSQTKGLDLANALKPILARGDTRVIGATTSEEYKKYFTQDGALSRRFELVEIKEPKTDEVYPMIKNQIEHLTNYHGVKISRQMVQYIILNASCFNYSTANPDRTIDLIDRSMVTAKLLGKSSVSRKCVRANFDINIKIYEKMDINSKKATAYHEAGHFIVSRFSSVSQAEKILAISIMPALNYLGANIIEKDDVGISNLNPTKEYYIDRIATLMAGRIAEKMFTNSISAGAESDLESANRIAYNCITKYGLSKNFGSKVFLGELNYQSQTEKNKAEIDLECKKLLDKGTRRAERILSENKELLEELVKELLKQPILSEVELNKILKAYKVKTLR